MEVRTEFGQYGVVFNLHCEDSQEVGDVLCALILLENYLFRDPRRHKAYYRVRRTREVLQQNIKGNTNIDHKKISDQVSYGCW